MPNFKRRYINIDKTVYIALRILAEKEKCYVQDINHSLLVSAIKSKIKRSHFGKSARGKLLLSELDKIKK